MVLSRLKLFQYLIQTLEWHEKWRIELLNSAKYNNTPCLVQIPTSSPAPRTQNILNALIPVVLLIAGFVGRKINIIVIRGLSECTAIEETDCHHTTGIRVLLGSLESGSTFCISNILVSKHLSWRPLRLPDIPHQHPFKVRQSQLSLTGETFWDWPRQEQAKQRHLFSPYCSD